MRLADLRGVAGPRWREAGAFANGAGTAVCVTLCGPWRTSLEKALRQHRIYNDYSALWLTAAPSWFRVCLMTGGA